MVEIQGNLASLPSDFRGWHYIDLALGTALLTVQRAAMAHAERTRSIDQAGSPSPAVASPLGQQDRSPPQPERRFSNGGSIPMTPMHQSIPSTGCSPKMGIGSRLGS